MKQIIAKVTLSENPAVEQAYEEYIRARLNLQRALSEECVQVEENAASCN